MLDEKLFNKKEVVAVAFSGGMDSTCLIHLLHNNADKLGITVKAINVEHGIRGESSLLDSEFVKNFCKKYDIELKTYSVCTPLFAKKHGYSEEQAARILRYECFDNALIEGFCDKIATAHHSNDNAETVLFNLFRGSSLSGVCGIPKIACDGKIIRPLLSATKEQIVKYVLQNDLEYVHDGTNDENKYTRNFLRNEIIPQIEERFPEMQASVSRFSSLASKDEALLSALSDKLIKGSAVIFSDELNFPLFSRACIKVMKKLGITKDFESAHIEAIYSLKDCQTGKSVHLKNGVKAFKSKDRVIFEKIEEKQDFEITLTLPFEFHTSKYDIIIEKVENTAEKEDNALYFDGDKLPKTCVLRTRRTGDEILSFGGTRKSLKKYFNDKKIDARISKNLPIIASGSEVYAVCSVDISLHLKIDEKTKDIYKLTCKRKGE